MRILFLTSSMEGGGAERVAALLCNAWARHGHDVVLMPTFSGRGGCSFPLDRTVVLDFLADHVAGSRSRARRLWALRRAIRKVRPDIIVSFLAQVNVAAILAARGTGIPVIVSERTYPSLPLFGRAVAVLRKLTYRFAAAVVVQSEDAAEWVRRECSGARPIVIPNPLVFPIPSSTTGIPPQRICQPGRKQVLALGRLDAAKRFDVLVSAFSRVAPDNPYWDLVILGHGPERCALEDQAMRAGLADRVHLPGFVGNVSDWYRQAEIQVVPSAYEGFPNVLIEAMAHGLPVIAFDIRTGPREITEGGLTGVLLPDNDHVERLTDALGSLMRDGQRRQELGRLAVRVRERYALDAILDEWTNLIKHVIGTR